MSAMWTLRSCYQSVVALLVGNAVWRVEMANGNLHQEKFGQLPSR